jgi:hypothetical protein
MLSHGLRFFGSPSFVFVSPPGPISLYLFVDLGGYSVIAPPFFLPVLQHFIVEPRRISSLRLA